MSDDTATLPVPGDGEPAPDPGPGPARHGHKGLLAVVASVVAVVLIAGGGFAAWQFLSGGGPRPAEVLPASTFALVSVDLDPSGGQKVEAIKALRSFPSFRKRLGITTDSDVLQKLFDKALADGPCKALDYAHDVKPWIGQRAGVGGVVVADKPVPVLALQVTDADGARAGFAKLAKCASTGDDQLGWTVSGDYLVASDSTAHAKSIAAAGTEHPLSEDSAYTKWTDEAGGDGIVNVYVAKRAATLLGDEASSKLKGGFGLVPPGLGDVLVESSAFTADDDPSSQLDGALKNFEGAAAVLRFHDGGIELSSATSRPAKAADRTVGDHVGALPKDTAAVVAGVVPSGLTDSLNKIDSGDTPFSLGGLLGSTGLDFPDDLVTLLGSSLSLSVGGDAPTGDITGPGDLPLGLLVHGDDAKIQQVISKVESATGAQLSDLPATVATGDGKVAVASTKDYADALVKDGSLGDSEAYQDAVPHADQAVAVGYVSFSASWRATLHDLAAKSDDQDLREVVANLDAVKALGASAWYDGTITRGLVRVSLR